MKLPLKVLHSPVFTAPAVRRVIRFLRRRLFLVLGLATGFLPVPGPAGFLLGGVLGYFADEFLFERRRRSAVRDFFQGQPEALSGKEETRILALAWLYSRLRFGGELSGGMDQGAGGMDPLLRWLGPARDNRLWLEKFLSLSETVSPERETALLLALNTLLSPGEKEGFLAMAAEEWGDRTAPPEVRRLAERVLLIWGIPGDRISGGLLSPRPERASWLILGLEPGASRTDIRKNYRLLAGQFHPDTNAHLTELQKREANEAFLRIRKAYEVLSGEDSGGEKNAES